jgi:hypothetical protein
LAAASTFSRFHPGHSFRRSVAFDLSIVQHDHQDFRRNEKSNCCDNRALKSNIAISSGNIVETSGAEKNCDQEVSVLSRDMLKNYF